MPCTKLGRLVQQGKIKSLEHIYLFSLPIKEHQIVDHFIGAELKDEVMKICPVQKQTTAGVRMRFKVRIRIVIRPRVTGREAAVESTSARGLGLGGGRRGGLFGSLSARRARRTDVIFFAVSFKITGVRRCRRL